MRPRDSQRQRVYAAERELIAFSDPDGGFQHFRDLTKFVRKMANSKRVQKAYPGLKRWRQEYRVVERRHGGGACADANEIVFRPGSWTRWIAVHEFAHLLHFREQFTGTGPDRALKGYAVAHGWRFCQIYLHLARLFLAEGHEKALKIAFRSHRVKYRTPRRITAEQRFALANRLRRMRGDPLPLAA